MKCPVCGEKSRVVGTDPIEGVVVRYRHCKVCSAGFQTHEATVRVFETDRSKSGAGKMEGKG